MSFGCEAYHYYVETLLGSCLFFHSGYGGKHEIELALLFPKEAFPQLSMYSGPYINSITYLRNIRAMRWISPIFNGAASGFSTPL